MGDYISGGGLWWGGFLGVAGDAFWSELCADQWAAVVGGLLAAVV